MPRSRGRALLALAGSRAVDPERLLALPGIGPWTASYVALRACSDDDAFLPGDLGVRHGLEHLGHDSSPRAAAALAERWRPRRAFALAHLWAAASAAVRPRPRPSPRATA